MRIPKTIRVVGKTYTVHLGRKDFALSQEGKWGEVDPTKQEIDLRGDLVHEQREEALLHEVLHAIDNGLISTKVSEEIVYAMSAGLYAVFKDNGWWPDGDGVAG